MNLNSSPSPFPIHDQQVDHDNDQQYHHQPFGPNSSSSLSCHIFFNSTQDHNMGYYDHHQLYQPPYKPDDGYAYLGGSTHDPIKNKVVQSGLKLTLWKKEEEDNEDDGYETTPQKKNNNNNNNPVKWMSSKMRLMQKMKKNPTHRVALKITKLEDDNQKLQQPYSSLGTDHLSSNSSSYYNNNSPIRVCADCNTTKTPLWRSGPKGPKSLCNACGIRQRKARRAMAAAAAAATGVGSPTATTDQLLKIKVVQQKEKTTAKNGLKKRCRTAVAATAGPVAGSPAGDGKKKMGFEDFLINLSEKLALHRVFPEDEKDAAILLMALSSGLVHG